MSGRPRATAVVPTLGTSPHLGACLEALRADGGPALEIVVVAQPLDRSGRSATALASVARAWAPRVDRWLELPVNRGFAGGTNAGIRASAAGRHATPFVATVNDDAVVRPGWLDALVDALEGDPGAAAAQGVNLRLGGGTVDGWGLGWNRWWQAVQLGHGVRFEEAAGTAAAGTAPVRGPGPREVFGVSATAAVYRRAALGEVGLFDERLVSWYEDAELAVRLRRAGWRAWSVPAARAEHAGGTTGGRRPVRYNALLYGNRWLVVARMLGRRFPRAVPRMLLRDLRDVARHPELGLGVALGWGRALRLLGRYLAVAEAAVEVDPGAEGRAGGGG